VFGWQKWSLVARQWALTLGAVALLIGGIVYLSGQVAEQVRYCLDTELYHQAVALHARFVNEGYYLRDEAQLLAHYEEIFTWLAEGDTQRLKRLLSLHQSAHEADHVYLVTAQGQVYTAAAEPPLDPAVLPHLEIVRLGFGGQALAELTTVDDRIWLVAVAPHTNAEGVNDTVVVIAHEMDAVALEALVGGFHGLIVLTDGTRWVGPAEADLPPRVLHDLRRAARAPTEEILQPYSVRHEGTTYEVLLVPLGATHSGSYALALVKQATVLDATRTRALVGAALLALALVGMALLVIHFHKREIFLPLRALNQVAQRIAAGDLDVAIAPRGMREIHELAASIEAMRQRVKSLLEQEQALRQQLAARLEEQSGTLVQMCREREQLLTRLISAQEEERRRVSRELHDETSQELANLIVRLGALARTVDDPEVLQHLQRLRQHAARTLEGVNRIVMDLRPGLLDEYGLVPAVQWYADSRLSPLGVQVKVKVRGTPQSLSPYVQVSVYRVLQEAINNIAQHAHARQATLLFEWQPDALQVTVTDDGRGFAVDEVARNATPHFGLLGMRERIHLIGGEFQVESAPGQGTRIRIRVPYEAHAGVERHVAEGPTKADPRAPGG